MNLSRLRQNTEKFHSLAIKIDKYCDRLDKSSCFEFLPITIRSKRRDKLRKKITDSYQGMLSLKQEILSDSILIMSHPEVIKLKTMELEDKLKEVHTRILLCQMATLLRILPEERGDYESVDLS